MGTGLILFLIGLPQSQIRSNLIVFIFPMIVRLYFLFLAIQFIFKNKKIFSNSFTFFFLSGIIVEYFSFFTYQEFPKYILSLVNLIKIIFYPLVLIFFLKKLDYTLSFNFLKFVSVIAPFAIILGLFGIGFTQYGGMATIGVWPYGSSNALSSIMFVLSVFNFYLFTKTDEKKYFFIGLLIIFSESLTGSKMGILSTMLSLILIVLIYKKKNFYYFFFISFTIILSTYFLIDNLDKILAVQRMMSQLNNYNLDHLIFNGREDRFDIFKEVIYSYNPIELLFGRGYYMPNYLAVHSFGQIIFDNIELDPLDIIVKYGFIGFAIVYGWWFYLLLLSFTNKIKTNKIKLINFFVVSMLIFQSSVAGHVVFAGLSNIYILVFINFLRKEDELLFKENKYKLCK
jgi:hypothetical protein